MTEQQSIYTSFEDVKTPVSLLLKGEPGTGKTFKACQFPNPAIFNFDENLAGVRKLPEEVRKNIKVVNPRTDSNGKELNGEKVWDHFVKQLKYVVADDSVDTIILDSLTTIAELLQDKVLGTSQPSSAMKIQDWGTFSRYMKWLGENLVCAPDRDKTVIVVAHERKFEEDQGDGTTRIRYSLNLGGSMKDTFDLFFTDCWRCYVQVPVSGGIKFMVRTLPSQTFNAKCSLDLPKDFQFDDYKDEIIKQL